MTLRTDHVAGAAAIIAGVVVYLLSGDLPFGRASMPGAGMMPKLLCGLLIVFGLVLIVRAGSGERFAEVPWRDLLHAIPVLIFTAAIVAAYSWLGFIISMAALLTGLALFERRNPLIAIAYGIGIAVASDALFVFVLKSPLERGLIGF